MVKLTQQDWLDLGLETLAKRGFTALKAGSLTKEAGVTRGSFYGYFKDVSTYHEALLEAWMQRSQDVAGEIAHLEPRQQLEALITASARSDAKLERAIRVWADTNDHVSRAVQKLDEFRLQVIEHILRQIGQSDNTARLRARFLYAAAIGVMMVPEGSIQLGKDDSATLAKLILQT